MKNKSVEEFWKDIMSEAVKKYSSGDSVWEIYPPSIEEFICSPDFLDMGKFIFPGVKEDLINMFSLDKNYNFKYNYAVLIEAPGSGKSELASIALAYLVVWLLCLRNPQKYLGLSPFSRIQIVNSSASGDQSRRVVYGYLKEKMKSMPFLEKMGWQPDDTVESELRFPKGIYVTPCSSTGKTVLGTNLFAIVMDELSEYVRTRDHDVAEEMYNKFYSRIFSRFGHTGKFFILLISQARYGDDFIEKKFREWQTNNKAYVKRRAYWEARPNLFKGEYFPITYRDDFEGTEKVINIPVELKSMYESDPILFLRNVASIPSRSIIPFIGSIAHLRQAFPVEKKDPLPERFSPEGAPLPFYPSDAFNSLPASFVGVPGLEYYVFADLAKGKECKVGFCMLHKGIEKEIEWYDANTGRFVKEKRPILVIDLITRFVASPDREIEFSEVRDFIIRLKKERSFNIKTVGTDSWQSIDFRQIMTKMGFNVDIVSVQGDKTAYQTLKDVLSEGRLEGYYRQSLWEELAKLEEKDGKVYSRWYKDQADALCGAVCLACRDQFMMPVKDKARPGEIVRPVVAPSLFGKKQDVGIPAPVARIFEK